MYHANTGFYDWLLCVFMVFNVIFLLFVNHLKDFIFSDLQTAWWLVFQYIHGTMVTNMIWVGLFQ